MKRIFIAFEGIDGCGKTTQLKYVSTYLKERGYDVYNTKEPTDSNIGQIIKKVLTRKITLDERTLGLLCAADRSEHILNPDNGIGYHIERGRIVLTDRYYFSSYAYNSNNVDIDFLMDINKLNTELMRPTLHIYIDIDPEVAIKRISMSRETIELFETQRQLEMVRDKYYMIFDKLRYIENIHIINGNDTEDNVFEAIKSVIDLYIPVLSW